MDSSLSAEMETRLSKDGSAHVTDEVINTITSSLGAILALGGVVFLLVETCLAHKPWHFTSFLIYGFGLVSLFIISALHHGVNGSSKTNHFLRQLDYCAIFFMIAGTMTPFCFILLRNTFGFAILAFMWMLAIVGIIIKALFPNINRLFTTALYVGMGWVGVGIFYPTYQRIHWHGLLLLSLGGILYTTGAVIYILEKPNPMPGKFGFHEIWHIFVLTAAASHFCVMLFYLLPY